MMTLLDNTGFFTEKPDTELLARWTLKRDTQAIVDIGKVYADPWNEDDIIRHLRHRNAIGITLEHLNEVIGWMTYELYPDRLNLSRLMIKESRLRHGYGTFLMSYLTNKLSVQRRTNITIEVNERNVRAQLFFHKCGFIASPCGDVISMKYSIGMNDVWG